MWSRGEYSDVIQILWLLGVFRCLVLPGLGILSEFQKMWSKCRYFLVPCLIRVLFLGGNTRGENNESSTTLRYNRCNREDTARILTLPKSEDFRLRLAAKMITAKIETLTVMLVYLVLIETV